MRQEARGIEQMLRRNGQLCLFFNLANETVDWQLTEVDLATRTFPCPATEVSSSPADDQETLLVNDDAFDGRNDCCHLTGLRDNMTGSIPSVSTRC